jgi:hemoglobin
MSDAQPSSDSARPVSVYEYVGGDAFFVELVEHFYDGVERDAVMRPMYPAELSGSKARLAGFLIQYWGGPQTYSEQRGHPRLRMRHVPFVIGASEAASWYGHMEAALDAMHADDVVRPVFLEYFARAAEAMINVAP